MDEEGTEAPGGTARAPVMRWQATAPGAPLARATVHLPPPGPGEIRLRVAACALNFADLLMLEGRYQDQPASPITPGLEMAGSVEAHGPGVTAPALGARVAVYNGQGGLSQAINVPAALCAPLPEGMAPEIAASVQVGHGTAHLALVRRAALRAGDRLVVTGAGGGAGLAAVELGAALGAEVVAVARGEEKRAAAERAGAHHLLDAEADDLRQRIKALGGADVVYETVGGAVWEAVFRSAKPEGRLLAIGFAGGEVPQIRANHLLVKNLTVIGVNLGGYRRFAPEALRDSLSAALGWVADGRLAPTIGARFPLTEADAALAALRAREVAGKIVVTVA